MEPVGIAQPRPSMARYGNPGAWAILLYEGVHLGQRNLRSIARGLSSDRCTVSFGASAFLGGFIRRIILSRSKCPQLLPSTFMFWSMLIAG